jgi:VanZ family protein
MAHGRPRAGDLVLPIAVSAALVGASPAIGDVRRWLRLSFPGHFVSIVTAGLAAGAAAAVVAAIRRIRDRRLLRFGILALAVAVAIVYAQRSALGNPDSDVVERVHFLEYGLVTWLFYRAWAPLHDLSAVMLAMLAAFTVGICEEGVEWFVPGRIGELRDVFLNGAAIVSGALVSWALRPVPVRGVSSARSARALLVVGAIAVAALAAFIDTVHIGHEIEDADGRRFRSIYTADELAALSGARRQQWATHPPLERPARYAREDQYASEGLWHVQRRNNLWSNGDVSGALNENRLLEEYFAPVLDAPSYVSRSGHRWVLEQQADAERRSMASAQHALPFVSQAQGGFPIFTWSRTRFRAASALLVLALLAAPFIVRRRLDYPVSEGAPR